MLVPLSPSIKSTAARGTDPGSVPCVLAVTMPRHVLDSALDALHGVGEVAVFYCGPAVLDVQARVAMARQIGADNLLRAPSAATANIASALATDPAWSPDAPRSTAEPSADGDADAAAPATNGFRPVSLREAEVIDLVRRGMTNRAIAEQLRISVSTVKKHVHNALRKRGALRRRQVKV